MKTKKILNTLFWILLVFTVILLSQRIFGNSSGDLQVIIPITLMLLIKTWSITDEQKEFKHEVKMSFSNVKTDISKLKKIRGGNK